MLTSPLSTLSPVKNKTSKKDTNLCYEIKACPNINDEDRKVVRASESMPLVIECFLNTHNITRLVQKQHISSDWDFLMDNCKDELDFMTNSYPGK
ncbi:hypothetical protein GJ496_003018 [Pomphorhynchus laevis]|nr:hypothetical protein GJ496_003018 [Pomphorhynchus laevis]